MENKDIEKIFIFTNSEGAPDEIYVFSTDGTSYKSSYEVEKHDELIKDFLAEKGIDISEPGYLEESRGLFEAYECGGDEHSEIEALYQTTNEESLAGIKKDGKFSTTQKIAAGVATLGAAVAGITGIAMATNSSEENEVENQAELTEVDKLLSNLSVDNERRIFFEAIDTTLESINTLTLDKEVFALEEDKDAVLTFTTDELIAASIVLNNYSIDEVKEIFGDHELNSAKILSNYQSFATKMMIYSMNGKASSTISTLIRDEENREWFEKIEKALVKFNKKPSNENADKLIRLFAYFYQHGINGTDNLENDEASLNGIKNLVLNMMRGYYDANTQDEYRKYLVVSTAPGEFDDNYRTNKESQVQKGETLKFYLDEAEKGVCTISVVEEHIKSIVEKVQQGSLELDQTKNNLVVAVLDAGDTELAARVLEAGLTEEVLKEFENAKKKSKEALNLYRTELSAIDNSLPSYVEIKEALDKEYGPFEEVKDDVLYNNRIRGITKINEVSANVISKDKWNNMSSEEKIEHAKEHGTVVSTTTETKEEKVEYDDLTPSQKQEADKQKEQIDKTVAIGNAYNDGKAAAFTFATQNDLFSYSFIDPLNNKAVRNNGSLYDFVRLSYIYNGKSITFSDSKVQGRYSSALSSYKTKTSDSDLIEAYKKGWKDAINSSLSQAIADGKEGRQDYLAAKEALDKKNSKPSKEQPTKVETTTRQETTTEKETTTKPETTTKAEVPVVTEKPDENEIDPNLNPSIADSDEGFEDIYDEDFDGYIASDEIDEFIPYMDSIIEEETTGKVLIK